MSAACFLPFFLSFRTVRWDGVAIYDKCSHILCQEIDCEALRSVFLASPKTGAHPASSAGRTLWPWVRCAPHSPTLP